MTRRRLIQLGLGLGLGLALLVLGLRGELPGVSGGPTGPIDSVPGVQYPEIGFRDAGHLEEHFRKHGVEFGSITRIEYLRRAQLLRDRPAGGEVLESVREDGVVTRFDRREGSFLAFDRDRVIRTFFRPNDGEGYYQRQLKRGDRTP